MRNIFHCLLFFVTILSFHNSITAQTILYSEEQKFGYKNNEFSIVGRVRGDNFIYRTDNGKHYLDILNDSLKRNIIVELDFIAPSIDQIKIVATSQNMVVLYQYHEGKIVKLEAAVLGLDGRLNSMPQLLDSTYVVSGLLARNGKIYDFDFAPDNNSFFVYRRGIENKREYLKIKLFSSALNLLYFKDVLLDAGQPIVPQQFVLSNDYKLYFTAYLYANTSEKKNEFADIYTVDFKQDNITKYAVPLEGQYIDQLYIKYDVANTSLAYAAFYTTNKKGSVEGILYGYIASDEDKAPYYKATLFNEKSLTLIGSKKNKSMLDYFDIRQVVVRKDGGVLLIAEYYNTMIKNNFVNTGIYSSYYGSGMQRTITEYTYGDILVVNINADGSIAWENLIRKNQISQEDAGMFSSFAFVNTGKYLVFIYNDYTAKRNNLTLASIDVSGKIAYHQVRIGDAKYDWVPKYAKQTTALSVLIPCFNKGTIAFAGVYF